MEKDNFEMKLTEMTKPEIPPLKHRDMLGNAIVNAKDKSIVSLWWLSVPAFIILMLVMKGIYMPGTSLVSNMTGMEGRNKYTSLIFFLISPIVVIIFNALSIRKIHFLSGSPKSINFLETIWINILAILLSVIVLVIYSL
jgi:hypothetical protein